MNTCRCGHYEGDHESGFTAELAPIRLFCLVKIRESEFEDPAEYCQCGEYVEGGQS